MELRGARHHATTRVLGAIERVPRELFVPATFADQAYENVALPIGHGQTISQPLVVALMTAGARGRASATRCSRSAPARATRRRCWRGSAAASSPSSAIARCCKEAEERFAAAAPRTTSPTRFGDGTKGWPEQAPFDRIIVTAAAPDVPGPLLDSLAEGGILVAPVGAERRDQQLLRVRRTGETFAIEDLGPVRFVPLVEGLPRASKAH